MTGSWPPTASCPLRVPSKEETVPITWNGFVRVILTDVAPDLGDPVESREGQSDERNPMTLPRRQERVLRRADHALCQSDPDLTSMLSIFARLTAAEGMPAREQLLPQGARAWRALRWPVAAVTFLAVFVADGGSRAATAYSAARRRRARGRAAVATARSDEEF
jgi:hypothetical protein